MRKLALLSTLALAVLLGGCSIVKYSFSGTSIQPDVKTVTINYFEYKALKVNPTLSNALTEAMKDKFRKLTKLEQVDIDGDLELSGAVTGYEVRAAEYVHWWTFLGAYMEIGDCTFAQVVSIRKKRAQGKKLDKQEQQFYRDNVDLIEIRVQETDEEKALFDEWMNI